MTYKPRLLGSITNQTGCSPNLIHPSMSLSTYPSGSFRKLERFEASTYSEVLKAVDMADNNKPVVMKIMRALSKGVIRRLPSVATRGCQSYNDILNELVVTQALSQLHEGVILGANSNSFYKTHFFCLIHEIKVVSGTGGSNVPDSSWRHDRMRGMVERDKTSVQSSLRSDKLASLGHESRTHKYIGRGDRHIPG